MRIIRTYHIRDPKTGNDGPWLAGMTLDPSVASEGWSHQRGYVCMIEEFGGRPVSAGQSFSAAFLVGCFDSIDEMHRVYDQHAGHWDLSDRTSGWRLLQGTQLPLLGHKVLPAKPSAKLINLGEDERIQQKLH